MKPDNLFFIGSHSVAGEYIPQANGEGIVSCTLDIGTGTIKKVALCMDEPNSTYLAKSPSGDFLFVAGDRYFSPGKVNAFAIRDDGSLDITSSVQVPGQATCHVACHTVWGNIYVSSYWDGKLTLHQFNGSFISPAVKEITYQGSGPNKERQEGPHAHQAVISPDGVWLYVCDLGSDRIWVHKTDIAEELDIIHETVVPSRYGPRHLVCHPYLPLLYVLCELNAHVLTFRRDDQTGSLKLIDDLPSLPYDYKGKPSAAALKLHTSGKTLMTSDRGLNSVSFFFLDSDSGLPVFETSLYTQGECPRDFAVDPTGNWLLAANQNSDTIVPFKLDPKTGLPTGKQGSTFQSGTPVCIEFL